MGHLRDEAMEFASVLLPLPGCPFIAMMIPRWPGHLREDPCGSEHQVPTQGHQLQLEPAYIMDYVKGVRCKNLDVSVLVQLRLSFLVSLDHVFSISMISSNNIYSTNLLYGIKNHLQFTQNIAIKSEYTSSAALQLTTVASMSPIQELGQQVEHCRNGCRTKRIHSGSLSNMNTIILIRSGFTPTIQHNQSNNLVLWKLWMSF
ncbi:hypothetical protein Leryth_001717 [Lithospermum erythrorhizon]|nr:hypothetical protein Leryth_001717 [Lithospermum erythrorhizon]